MAGLSGLLVALIAVLTELCMPAVGVLAVEQEPPSPPGHRQRVADLLEHRTDYLPSYYAKTLFQSLTRLEHLPAAELLPAWQAMTEAAGGGDWGLANLVLYARRHGLPLPSEQVGEGADPALERALAAWGDQDLMRTEELLTSGFAAWPADSRWSGNLGWLRGEAPPTISATSTARELALAVLAARGTLD